MPSMRLRMRRSGSGGYPWLVPVHLDYPLLKATSHVPALLHAFVATHRELAAAAAATVYTGVRAALLSLPARCGWPCAPCLISGCATCHLTAL